MMLSFGFVASSFAAPEKEEPEDMPECIITDCGTIHQIPSGLSIEEIINLIDSSFASEY